jgi:hypothetical protein
MLKGSVRCVRACCGWLIYTPQLHLVNDASHTVLLEAGVSLADILKERNLLPPEEGYPLDRMAPVPAISALISREQAKMAAHASTQVHASHPVGSCCSPPLHPSPLGVGGQGTQERRLTAAHVLIAFTWQGRMGRVCSKSKSCAIGKMGWGSFVGWWPGVTMAVPVSRARVSVSPPD